MAADGLVEEGNVPHAIPQFEFRLEQDACIVGLGDVEILWRHSFVSGRQATWRVSLGIVGNPPN